MPYDHTSGTRPALPVRSVNEPAGRGVPPSSPPASPSKGDLARLHAQGTPTPDDLARFAKTANQGRPARGVPPRAAGDRGRR